MPSAIEWKQAMLWTMLISGDKKLHLSYELPMKDSHPLEILPHRSFLHFTIKTLCCSGGFIHNRQRLETTQKPIRRRMDKQIMLCA